MKACKIIIAVVLTISLIANVLLFLGLRYDEQQIAKANAERVQAYNDYRTKLIELKNEHPIIFKDLQIPPPVSP